MKRELCLLLDEWDNDRNFVGSELELICEKFNVTVVCNTASYMMDPSVKYFIYQRPGIIHALAGLLHMIADIDAWREIKLVFKEPCRKAARLSEVVRFYINADMFRAYLKKNGLLKDNVLYYSYWYFWKCYAITHEIDKFKNSRVITRTHEYDLYDYTSPSGYQPFKESMDDKLDSVIFISEHGRDYYLGKYNKPAGEKYKLYRLGTKDPLKVADGIIPTYETRAQFRKREDMDDDGITLVSCSSVIARKRVQRIVLALDLIDDIRIEWIHFGTGDQADELKELAEKKLKDKSNIEYKLMGYVTNDKLHEYYRDHYVDIFITASISEGNPVSVMEAMSYGIPVIAPAVCNFPNMIKDCGILVDEKCEPEDLAAAIREMAMMKEEGIRTFRNAVRKCWEEDFDADRNNRRFVDEVLC